MNFLFSEPRSLVWVAVLIYGLAFAIASLSLLRHRRYYRTVLFALICGGWVFQTLGLFARGYEVQACPLGNPFEIIQFILWSAIGLFVLVFPFYRVNLLGFFITAFGFLLGLLSLTVPGWDHPYPSTLFGGNPWIELHAALAISSYGVFGLLALIALMYLIQQHGLKRKQSGPFFRFMASIRELDLVGLRLLSAGTVILSISLGVGSLYWVPNFESVSHAKLLATILLWAFCILIWALRLRGSLVSRSFAWGCLLLFVFALVSLWPVDQSRRSHWEPVSPTPAQSEELQP